MGIISALNIKAPLFGYFYKSTIYFNIKIESSLLLYKTIYMGRIQIEDIEFYAYHGCFEEEKIIGNRFIVNADIEADTDVAANTDKIDDAINYQTIYEIICKEMQQPSNLLEHVAQRILDNIYNTFSTGIQKASIKISKLNPPLTGQIGRVSVTLTK